MKSRIALLASLIIVATAAVAGAGGPRILEHHADLAGIDRLVLEIGVGDVVVSSDAGTELHTTIQLSPRRGGFFSSLKKAERDVENAKLETHLSGGELHLTIESDSSDRRFEENWTIVMPAHVALELEMGVGDLEIAGNFGGINLEQGVGDSVIRAEGGEISVESGVGDVRITAPLSAFGFVKGEAGVGDVTIKAGDQTITGDGFVGHSAKWRGDGPASIEAESGVGDIRIVLK
jgi:hypothetical protein